MIKKINIFTVPYCIYFDYQLKIELQIKETNIHLQMENLNVSQNVQIFKVIR